MKRMFKLGVMLTISISALSACGNTPGNLSVIDSNGYTLTSDGTTVIAGQADKKGPKGKPGKGPEMKKGGFGGPGPFPLFAGLNFTDEQKKQLEALRPTPPAAPDKATMDAQKTAMEAVRKEINDAFISDNFDATALQAKLDALKPERKDDHITIDATMIVKTYDLLTTEQKAKIEANALEMANATPKVMPSPPNPPAGFDPAKQNDARFDKLATDLALTDAQKVSLKEIMQPPAKQEKPDFQKMFDQRKAVESSILAELKSGNATAESITTILKTNAPPQPEVNKGNELERLSKIHAVLNAEQRKKFIEIGPKGPGGPGNHGGPEEGHKGPDMKGGPGGGFHKGPGGPGGHGGPGGFIKNQETVPQN